MVDGEKKILIDEEPKISVDGMTKIYGIIGDPVSHSFSPLMQTMGMQAINENAVYLPFLTEKERLGDLLKAFEEINLQGFNVTVPFKSDIIPYLDEIDPAARVLGSVNTVIHTRKGWKGYSTDGAGFVRGLQVKEFDPKGKKVALLGAGGSAKAVAYALCEAEISHLDIINRTKANSEALMDLLGSHFPNITISTVEDLLHYDLLVNTTSVGMREGDCLASHDLIKSADFVCDIIYNPIKTDLLKKAEAMGKETQNGMLMLLYQGVLALEIWTKKTAPVKVMAKVLKNHLS